MTKFKPSVEQLCAALRRSARANDSAGTQRAADELIERAYEAIEDDDPDQPMSIAEVLQQVGHPAGYELAAVSLDHREESEKAIETLEKGVKALPNASRLWELLGNMRSDAGAYELAAAAFEKALACGDVDAASVQFNIALTLCRQHKYAEALSRLGQVSPDSIQDQELRLNTLALTTSVLNSLERYEEALKVARKTLDGVDEEQCSDDEAVPASELHAQMAEALRAQGKANEALEEARHALVMDQGNEAALHLIRSMADRKSAESQLIQVTVTGTWPEAIDQAPAGSQFFQTFTVIADTPDEAMGFVRELALDTLRESIAIRDSEVIKPMPNEPKGLCQVSPFLFFAEEDGEQEEHDHSCDCDGHKGHVH